MGKWTKLDLWFYGLLNSFVQSAANGVVAGLASIGIDPEHFNLTMGLIATLELVGVSVLFSSLLGAAGYIKAHELPAPIEEETPEA